MKTIGQQWRTCSYHGEEFSTMEKFLEHWNTCSVRVQYGYIDEDLGGYA